MKEAIEKFKQYANLYLVAVPLWSAIAYGFYYESQLVKKPDIEVLQTKADSAEKDLDDDRGEVYKWSGATFQFLPNRNG